jgi:TatD DNase family protein
LAEELKMPMFLHERDASAAFLNIVKDFPMGACNTIPAVVHCFTGSEVTLRRYVELDFYIGE